MGQVTSRPQASVMTPHCAPAAAQAPAVVVQARVSTEQVCAEVHWGHASAPPQPSTAGPHATPSEPQVSGVQPQALATPPPPHESG